MLHFRRDGDEKRRDGIGHRDRVSEQKKKKEEDLGYGNCKSIYAGVQGVAHGSW